MEVMIFQYRAGSFLCTLKVACIDGVNFDIAEAFRKKFDLVIAFLGDISIVVPLYAAEQVALGLRVPNQIDFSHIDLQMLTAWDGCDIK